MNKIKIAFFANIAYQLLEKDLIRFFKEHNITLEIFKTNFNNIVSDGLKINHNLKKFNPDFIVVFDNIHYKDTSILLCSNNNKINILENLSLVVKNEYKSKLIIANHFQNQFRPSGNLNTNINLKVKKFNNLLKKLSNTLNFFVLDIDFISNIHGLKYFLNSRNNYAYTFPFSLEAIEIISKEIFLIIFSELINKKKLIILDLDNTLWPGVIGEDVENFSLSYDNPANRAFIDFQEYLLELKNNGIMLAISSKNNPTIISKIFKIKNFKFKKSDFVSINLSFNRKDLEIKKIIKKINIHPKDVVFIDDSDFERDIVSATFPDMHIPDLGRNPENFIQILDEYCYFYSNFRTAEDKSKTEMILANSKRKNLKNNFINYHDYLKSLKMEIKVYELNDSNFHRCLQLINKTSQFNFNKYTMTERELLDYKSKNRFVYCAELIDKYGSNGIISCLYGDFTSNNLSIKNWVMSCRVFKRDVEYNFLFFILKKLVTSNKSKISIQYKENQYNTILKDLKKHLQLKYLSNSKYFINLNVLFEYNYFKIKTKLI